MTVCVLSVNGEIEGVYTDYLKAYKSGCEKYGDDFDFDIEKFDVK